MLRYFYQVNKTALAIWLNSRLHSFTSFSVQFIFIALTSFTSYRIIYIAFSPSLSLRHANTGVRWHLLLSCSRCHSHWWKPIV